MVQLLADNNNNKLTIVFVFWRVHAALPGLAAEQRTHENFVA